MWNKLGLYGCCLVLFCGPVLILTACRSGDVQIGNDAAKPFSPTPVSFGDLGSRAEDLPELLALIRDRDQLIKKAASERLIEVSRKQGDRVSKPLITEISRLCSSREEGLKYDENFEAVSLLADLLAERQNVMALDILVDCADFIGGVGGSSLNSRATARAVISYKGKAIPTLKKKLRTSSPDVKCEIGRILSTLVTQSEVSPQEAETILNNAFKDEKDESVQYCLEGALRVVRERK